MCCASILCAVKEVEAGWKVLHASKPFGDNYSLMQRSCAVCFTHSFGLESLEGACIILLAWHFR